ncbi:MAG: type II toxin-antitoxin system YafQ family toxin [Bacteroidales bacterium]|nr:type II toxin-antitoxin system YafQ family toxin [Bacteroidales bacterium]
MYEFDLSGVFKKDLKRINKRNFDKKKLQETLNILQETGTLPYEKYKTHLLKGNYKGYYDSHIEPNWLIIWKKTGNIIELARTGTHSDLFSK